MPPTQESGLPARIFIIQSPVKNPAPPPSTMVLDYSLKDNIPVLVLLPFITGPAQPRQKFRVYEKGFIQNLDPELGDDNGYLTRVQIGNTSAIQVQLLKYNPDENTNKNQKWNFMAGPRTKIEQGNDPDGPGGGPHGIDRHTITVDDVDGNPQLVLAVPADGTEIRVETYQSTQGQGQGNKIPGHRRLVDRQLWFYYWLPES